MKVTLTDTDKNLAEELAQKLLKAERERAAKVIEAQDVDPSFKHRMAYSIRAMEGE